MVMIEVGELSFQSLERAKLQARLSKSVTTTSKLLHLAPNRIAAINESVKFLTDCGKEQGDMHRPQGSNRATSSEARQMTVFSLV